MYRAHCYEVHVAVVTSHTHTHTHRGDSKATRHHWGLSTLFSKDVQLNTWFHSHWDLKIKRDTVKRFHYLSINEGSKVKQKDSHKQKRIISAIAITGSCTARAEIILNRNSSLINIRSIKSSKLYLKIEFMHLELPTASRQIRLYIHSIYWRTSNF